MPPKRSGLVPRTTRDGRTVNCKGETIGMSERVRIGGALGFPPDEPRVESGVIQFGSDWPGVFIRGDEAASFSYDIRRMMGLLSSHLPEWHSARDLAEMLEQCCVSGKRPKPIKVRRG